jgi:hypothetical protein
MRKIETRPIFFPSLAHWFSQTLSKSDKEIFKFSENIIKSPRFYSKTKNNYYYHPYCLWNAHEHILSQKITNLKKTKRIDNQCLVMLDSGGYQLAKGKKENKKFNPEIVLKWSEKNGDIFPIIDYPPWFDEYGKTFEDCLRLSVKNGEYYKKHRNKKLKNRILNVLQGRDFDEIDEWYDRIKHLKLDGWGIGGMNDNPALATYAIRLLYQKGELSKKKQGWVHFFGVSHFEAMLYYSVIQRELNKLCNVQISYDSATHSHTTKNGKFFEHRPNLARFMTGSAKADMPFMFSDLCESIQKFRAIHLSKYFDYKNVKKDTPLPLPYSPVIEGVSDTKDFLKNQKTYTLLGNLHNLWIMLEQKRLFDNLVFFGTDEVVMNCVGNELKQNINILNHVFSKKEIKRKYTMKITNPLEGFNRFDKGHGNFPYDI